MEWGFFVFCSFFCMLTSVRSFAIFLLPEWLCAVVFRVKEKFIFYIFVANFPISCIFALYWENVYAGAC